MSRRARTLASLTGLVLATVFTACEPSPPPGDLDIYDQATWNDAGFTLLGSTDILRNPEDDHTLRMREDAIRGRTDRFVLLFEKPAASPAD